MGSESIGRALVAFFRRPYRVTPLMVLLVSLIPLYLVTPHLVSAPKARPAVPLDAQIPLLPEWSIVYGALCFSLILLPVLCVREEAHIRLLVLAYLATWLPSYASFVIYPTIAPRPEDFVGEGFAAWSLQALYGADPPYNCFPSLHVGHSFVSALAILYVHRGVGWGRSPARHWSPCPPCSPNSTMSSTSSRGSSWQGCPTHFFFAVAIHERCRRSTDAWRPIGGPGL